jgi:hypothetical protein
LVYDAKQAAPDFRLLGAGGLEEAMRVAGDQAKAHELCAAMSTARLWRDRGKRQQARDLHPSSLSTATNRLDGRVVYPRWLEMLPRLWGRDFKKGDQRFDKTSHA